MRISDWSSDVCSSDLTRSFELAYTVTQADIDNGGVLNVASATGENPGDPEDEDEVEVPSDKQPGIEVTKVAEQATVSRSEERRVGKECVSTCRSRWSPDP